MNERELAKRLGCSRVKLQRDRGTGDGPPYVKLGRLVRYRESDVRAWLDAQTRRGGS